MQLFSEPAPPSSCLLPCERPRRPWGWVLPTFLPVSQWDGVRRAPGLAPAHSGWPSGLQEGGVESAFHKTSPGATPAAARKLYQVKGKKNIRATERPLSWDSFNTGDCFILDLGQVDGRAGLSTLSFTRAGTRRPGNSERI